VFQRALNDFHITYEICCVTRDSHRQFLLYSRLHEEIQDAFAAAGVEILSPAYTALRDANAVVLPKEPKGPRAAPGGFRIRPSQEG
jgi:small-conductance mechanosensitive channel